MRPNSKLPHIFLFVFSGLLLKMTHIYLTEYHSTIQLFHAFWSGVVKYVIKKVLWYQITWTYVWEQDPNSEYGWQLKICYVDVIQKVKPFKKDSIRIKISLIDTDCPIWTLKIFKVAGWFFVKERSTIQSVFLSVSKTIIFSIFHSSRQVSKPAGRKVRKFLLYWNIPYSHYSRKSWTTSSVIASASI